MRLLLVLTLALLASGCIDAFGPSDETGTEKVLGPGIRTTTNMTTTFHCDPLLFSSGGCPIVRIPQVYSLCANENPGYIGCNLTVNWTAQAGSVTPSSRLNVRADEGDGERTQSCSTRIQARCTLAGALSKTHHFRGPGEEQTASMRVRATLEPDPSGAPARGWFEIELNATLRS